MTLDTNTIALCNLIAAAGGGGGGAGGGGGIILGPTGVPLFASLLSATANASQRAVANAIDGFVANGGTLPLPFLTLLNLSPANLGNALSQIQGETGTGVAQAGVQAMNSFLSLVTNPFLDNRGFLPANPPPPPGTYYKTQVYKARYQAAVDPRRWEHLGRRLWRPKQPERQCFGRKSRSVGAGLWALRPALDYRVSPYSVVGFALGGGGTNYSISNGFGGGHSDMFQAAVYGLTRVDAAYVSAALAYGWHAETTGRTVAVAGFDQLTAGFNANNIAGRVEGGYRFAVPGIFNLPGFGLTPYGAFQMQAFYTPSYSETATTGTSLFALSYEAQTTNVIRTELGAWIDQSFRVL
ncbi:MAG: autotransporter outer membrane beta-barrel domain-containing protein [Bradyrhizobium sp.]